MHRQAFKCRHTPAVLPQSSHMFGTRPVLHICMWLLERSGRDYIRYGQLLFRNKQYKPQSQTGGAGSTSCQVAAVTSTTWWNEMGFYVNCLSAETWDGEGGCYDAVCYMGVVFPHRRYISALNLNLGGDGHKHNSRHACQSNTLIFDQTWRTGFNNGCEQQLERWKGIDLCPQVSWDFYGIG